MSSSQQEEQMDNNDRINNIMKTTIRLENTYKNNNNKNNKNQTINHKINKKIKQPFETTPLQHNEIKTKIRKEPQETIYSTQLNTQ